MPNDMVRHGPKFINLEGHIYGKLVVIGYAGKNPSGKSLWRCRCNCGREVIVAMSNLRCHHTISCGCFRRQITGNNFRTHGKSKSREYRIWASMLLRCHDANNPAYGDYGGRGIRVCRRWRRFENFLADMGTAPPLHSLDRVDNNKGYSPQNCRWATQSQQMRNTRRNHLVTYAGRTMPVAVWAEERGLSCSMLYYRLKRWPVEKALMTPRLR